jgi:hypothetical protein
LSLSLIAAATDRLARAYSSSAKKIFIEPLKLNCSTQTHPNIVLDHEIGETLAIDEDHSRGEVL